MSSYIEDRFHSLSRELESYFPPDLWDSFHELRLSDTQPQSKVANNIWRAIQFIEKKSGDITKADPFESSLDISEILASIKYSQLVEYNVEILVLECAKHFLVAKYALVVYSWMFSTMLSSTFPISRDIQYWKSLKNSHFRSFLYIFNRLPWNIVHQIHNLFRYRQHFGMKHLLARWNFIVEANRTFSRKLLPLKISKATHAISLGLLSSFHANKRVLILPGKHDATSYLLGDSHPVDHKANRDRMVESDSFSSSQQESMALATKYLSKNQLINCQNQIGQMISEVITLMVWICDSPASMIRALAKNMHVPTELHQSLQMLSESATAFASSDDTSETLSLGQSLERLLHISNYTSYVYKNDLGILLHTYGKPHPIARYWLPTVVGLYGSYQMSNFLALHKASLLSWFKESVRAVFAIFGNYIVEPTLKIYHTVRHHDREFPVMSADSLRVDLESLERMVRDYEASKYSGANEPLSAVGGMSLVMSDYEADLKAPIRTLVNGDLLRLFLIQIQKAKVDLELAMNAIDKLLKANELNFAVLAAFPSFVFLKFLIRQGRRFWRRMDDIYEGKTLDQIRKHLREVEIRLNEQNTNVDAHLSYQQQGFVLMEVHSLRRLASRLSSKETTDILIEDIREIESNARTVPQKLRTIDRIYRSHTFLNNQTRCW